MVILGMVYGIRLTHVIYSSIYLFVYFFIYLFTYSLIYLLLSSLVEMFYVYLISIIIAFITLMLLVIIIFIQNSAHKCTRFTTCTSCIDSLRIPELFGRFVARPLRMAAAWRRRTPPSWAASFLGSVRRGRRAMAI